MFRRLFEFQKIFLLFFCYFLCQLKGFNLNEVLNMRVHEYLCVPNGEAIFRAEWPIWWAILNWLVVFVVWLRPDAPFDYFRCFFFCLVYRLDDCAQFRFDCIYEDWRHYEWWASASGPLPRTIGRRTVLCVNKKNLVGILAQQTGSSYLPRWYNYIIAVRHFIFIFLLICQPIKFVCLYFQPIDLPVMVITCQTVRFVCVHPDGVRFLPFCPGAWRALNITGILLSFQYQRHCHCCAAIGA